MSDKKCSTSYLFRYYCLSAVWFSGNGVKIIPTTFVFSTVSHIPCSFSCVTNPVG